MFVYKVKLFLLRRKYRKLNQHNKTEIKNLCNINNIVVGKNTYGFITITDCSSSNVKLRIGSYCSIASDVKFILGGEHRINSVSTYPFKYQIFRKGREADSKGDIIIKDDVWIGLNAIIMSGVTIGQGAIIGAGSIVTKNIEPYSIAVGVPARVIKYRFDEDLRNKLLSIDIVSLFDKIKEEDLDIVYEELTMENLNKIMEKING